MTDGEGADWQIEEVISPRARRIRLELRPPNRVRLVVPARAPRAQARAFLISRHAWIAEGLARLAARSPRVSPLRWDGRDVLPFRGEPHRLLIEPAGRCAPGLRVSPGLLSLRLPEPALGDPEACARWLRRGLQYEAERRLWPMVAQAAARLGVPFRSLRVTDPESLWGSCSPDGRIRLSWRLVLAPEAVQRYVAVHEVCHLVYPNHSPAFWALVAREDPGHREARAWLRREGAALHAVLPRPA